MSAPGIRTELWDALAELSRRYPEWRIGQLVANVADGTDRGVWDVEDEELLKAVLAHLNQPLARPAHRSRAEAKGDEAAATAQEVAADERRSACEVAVDVGGSQRQLPKGAGKYASGQADTAQRVDEILREAVVERRWL